MSIETAQSTRVMVTATEADYRRDPTRWGSAEMAAHFPGVTRGGETRARGCDED